MITKQIKTVLLLSFIFFNVSLKAQWTGSWSCAPGETGNGTDPIVIQNVGGQSGASVNTNANNCSSFFTNITGTAPICVPNNFTVTATLQNPTAFGISEYDTHLTLLDGNPNNPNFFVAQMRADGVAGANTLQFANVGVNNTIPGCCNQQINSLVIPQITTTWTNFSIQVNGTQVTYFINGNPVTDNNNQVITQTMNMPVCSIIPQLSFKGMGIVDNLTITDDNTNVTLYSETFNSLQFAQVPACPAVTISPSFISPDCNNNNLQLFANPAAGQTYNYVWSGPNGFTSNLQNPIITNPTSAEVGAYTVVATLNGWNCITSAQTLNVNFEVPVCAECSDTCYWKVRGNTILGGNNIFGTRSNDHINIYSNNTPRGIIQANGYFGWRTTNPSTTFHVYADKPEISRSGPPSGVRFENLPSGTGDVMVIDANGYVYRQATDIIFPSKSKIDSLEREITALRSLINSTSTGNNGNQPSQNTLYQNKPNPFSDVTIIECNVTQMKSNAFIAIYDLTGKELMKYRVNGEGHNTVRVNSKNLADGMYIYSLIIDGEEVASKKMVISKQ
jgi:hypothetical protein